MLINFNTQNNKNQTKKNWISGWFLRVSQTKSISGTNKNICDYIFILGFEYFVVVVVLEVV